MPYAHPEKDGSAQGCTGPNTAAGPGVAEREDYRVGDVKKHNGPKTRQGKLDLCMRDGRPTMYGYLLAQALAKGVSYFFWDRETERHVSQKTQKNLS
jgi:hypothetical protein